MGYFPFFMDITGKQGVIVGGGKVAARKAAKLLAFGPALTVIAPCIEICMQELERLIRQYQTEKICFCQRSVQESDLADADFVIAATDDEEINSRVSAYCKERRIPVNVVDDREKCTFFFPALVKEGALTLAISTDGKSPVAASWIREYIHHALPEGLGEIIDLMGQVRPDVLASGRTETERRDILTQMFLYCLEKNGLVDGTAKEKPAEKMQARRAQNVTLEELRSLFI